MASIKSIGIYPWVSNSDNPYQVLYEHALIELGYDVKRIPYQKYLPLSRAIYKYKVDLLFLDWVHPFYTSKGFFSTMIKSLLSIVDHTIMTYSENSPVIIWNLHNLHRHDKKHLFIEKWSFKRLSRKVDFIRLFSNSVRNEVLEYLNLKSKYKIIIGFHGDYRKLYTSQTKHNLVSSRYFNTKKILFFGSIRRGKGVEQLITWFKATHPIGFELHIAGKCIDPELEQLLDDPALIDFNIYIENKYISNDLLSDYYNSSSIVILPYEEILSSGALLLAITFRKPIIASNLTIFKELLINYPSLIYEDINDITVNQLNSLIDQKWDSNFDFSVFDWQMIMKNLISNI